jgi:phage-related protein
MSGMTYNVDFEPQENRLVWLLGEVKSPPLSPAARFETGFLLRRLQHGELLAMPQSRPMPSVGPRCHELRINDVSGQWRLVYRVDGDAIVIAEVFAKKSAKTPRAITGVCRRRLKEYDSARS